MSHMKLRGRLLRNNCLRYCKRLKFDGGLAWSNEMVDWKASIFWTIVLTAILWAVMTLIRKLSK